MQLIFFPSPITDDPATDARESGNNAEALLKGDGSIVTQMMGLEYGSPKPYLPKDKFNLPKFMAKDSMESSVNPQGKEPVFKHIDTSNGNWAPNETKGRKTDGTKSLSCGRRKQVIRNRQ